MEAFKKLKRFSVMVYVPARVKGGKEKLSPLVAGKFRAPEMGRIFPKAVIVSPDQYQEYAAMTYKQMSDPKEFSKVSKQVKKALDGEVTAIKSSYAWYFKMETRAYSGTFVELIEDKTLKLKTDQGKEIIVSLEKLSSGAQAYARMLQKKAGGSEPEKDSDKETASPEPEAWESAKGGKSITATFISLTGTKITLKKASGQTSTFDVSLLSAKSQARAKELAGE